MSKIEPLTLAPTDSQSENIFDQFDGASTATTPVPASTGTESPPIDSTQQQTAGKPKIVYAPHPSYPPKADKMHVTGSGRFKITFDDRGNAKSVEIVQSTGNRTLDSNTIDTLKLWRAAPGNSSYVIVPIDYRQKRQYPSNSQTMTSQHQQSRRPEPPPPPRIDFPPPPPTRLFPGSPLAGISATPHARAVETIPSAREGLPFLFTVVLYLELSVGRATDQSRRITLDSTIEPNRFSSQGVPSCLRV
jgi:TonB family protein